MKSKLSTARLLVLVLAAGALLLAGCGAEDEAGVVPPPGDTLPGEPAEPAPDEPATDDEEVAGQEATMVELEEHEGSGYSGTAILTPDGESVYVDVEVQHGDDEAAAEEWDDDALRGLAAEIRSGTCEDPGETVQAVGRLQFGWGGESVDVPLGRLTQDDHVIVITRSETAAGQEEDDPFGEGGDEVAPDEDEGTEPADEDILEEDREPVACGAVQAGVSPGWDDTTEDDGTLGDDELGDDDDFGGDDDDFGDDEGDDG